MPSPKTIALKLERTLGLLSAHKVVSEHTPGPNHKERRQAIQRFCRKFGVPYADAREAIRDTERRMIAHGIDPHDRDALKKLEAAEKQTQTL